MFSIFKNGSSLLGATILVIGLGGGISEAQTTSSKSNDSSENQSSTDVTGTANNNAVLSGVSGGSGAKKVRVQGLVTHLPRTRTDQNATTDILGRADYFVTKKHRIRVQQSFTQLTLKDQSQYEFQPSDTVLAHYYAFENKPWGTSLQWRTGLSLPISNDSHRDDLLTRLTGSLIGIKSFMGGKLIGIGVPFVRYHAYEYNMSVSGNRLPWYTLGISMAAIYMLTSKWSLSTSLGYSFEGQKNSQFEDNPQQLNNGRYAIDADISYQALPALTLSLAYSQGANFMQDGRYELALYDDEVSRYTFGLIYTY